MEIKNDGMIGNLLKDINEVIPRSYASGLKICKLIKHSGDVVGYELSDGQKISNDEGIKMAKNGKIARVTVVTNKGNKYLRSLPDDSEGNNLSNLPSITD